MESKWLLRFQNEQLSGEQFSCYLQTFGKDEHAGIARGDWGHTRNPFGHVKFKMPTGQTDGNVTGSFMCGSVVQERSGS